MNSVRSKGLSLEYQTYTANIYQTYTANIYQTYTASKNEYWKHFVSYKRIF